MFIEKKKILSAYCSIKKLNNCNWYIKKHTAIK